MPQHKPPEWMNYSANGGHLVIDGDKVRIRSFHSTPDQLVEMPRAVFDDLVQTYLRWLGHSEAASCLTSLST